MTIKFASGRERRGSTSSSQSGKSGISSTPAESWSIAEGYTQILNVWCTKENYLTIMKTFYFTVVILKGIRNIKMAEILIFLVIHTNFFKYFVIFLFCFEKVEKNYLSILLWIKLSLQHSSHFILI